jgi:RNA recognition motif-containing protein
VQTQPRDRDDRHTNDKRPDRHTNDARPTSNTRTKPSRDVQEQSIYVANLPWSHSREDVQRMFERYGKVFKTSIITDKRNGKSKGLAFVDMPRPAAKTAIDALNGSSVRGRQIQARFAQPRQHGK